MFNFTNMLNVVGGVIAIVALYDFFFGRKDKNAGEPRSWGELIRVFGGIALAIAVVANIISGNAFGAWLLGLFQTIVTSFFTA